VPLALDTGAVCVEGLADADDLQAGLIGQLGQKLQNLRGRFACDEFFPHAAVYCRKGTTRVTFKRVTLLHFYRKTCPVGNVTRVNKNIGTSTRIEVSWKRCYTAPYSIWEY